MHSALYKRINQRKKQLQKFAKEAAYIVREIVSRCAYLFAGAVHCYSFRLVYYYNIAIVYSCQVDYAALCRKYGEHKQLLHSGTQWRIL